MVVSICVPAAVPVLSGTECGAAVVPPGVITTPLLAACVITAVPERPLAASVNLMVQVPGTAVAV